MAARTDVSDLSSYDLADMAMQVTSDEEGIKLALLAIWAELCGIADDIHSDYEEEES